MIIVIADDITGAAEIAGIASRHGLDTQLITRLREPLPAADVAVIATDTRSASEAEAVKTMRDTAAFILSQRNARTDAADTPLVIFKKTDSVLRGHIMAEARALTDVFGQGSALLIPQNPSKERIIKNGIYYVKGIGLSDTAFRDDPEFPALTSNVTERLSGAHSLSVEEKMVEGINIADATNSDDIRRQISKAGDNTLVAGAADCFEALLEKLARARTGSSADESSKPPIAIPHPSTLLVVCGSTQSRSLKDEPYIKNMCAEEIGVPDDVFHGGDPATWMERLERSYAANGSLVMKIGRPSEGGKAYAVRLRSLMSEAATRLINMRRPQCLIIEGGATAYALLMRTGWHSFAVRGEIAPGVVCMSRDGIDIILKPGSYAWGGLFG